jgi:hypothetical protein
MRHRRAPRARTRASCASHTRNTTTPSASCSLLPGSSSAERRASWTIRRSRASTNNARAALVVPPRLARDYQPRRRGAGRARRRPREVMAQPRALRGGGRRRRPAPAPSSSQFGRRSVPPRRSYRAEVDALPRPLRARRRQVQRFGTPFEQGIRHLVEAFLQSPQVPVPRRALRRARLRPAHPAHRLRGRDPPLVPPLEQRPRRRPARRGPERATSTTDAGIEAQARRLHRSRSARRRPGRRLPRAMAPARPLRRTSPEGPGPLPGASDASVRGRHARGDRALHPVTSSSSSRAASEDLLLSRTTFVNDDLAAIYGLEGAFGP